MNQDLSKFNGSSPENSDDPVIPEIVGEKPVWLALASFVLSLANICMCCCCSYLTIPASLILGITSLVKKCRGKGFAIAGVVISTLTVIFVIFSNIAFGDEANDMMKVYSDPNKYISMYEQTGEIPTEFEKYTAEKYDFYWKLCGCDDFEEFYAMFLDNFKQFGYTGNGNVGSTEPTESDSETDTTKPTRPSNYGEEPVNI